MRKPIQPQNVLPNPRVRAFLGKRRNHRVLVVTSSLVYLAILSLILFASELSFPALVALLLILVAARCLHGVLLNVGTQLIAANRVNNLDEREQGVWARAHHRAYRFVVFGTSAALLYLGVAAMTVLPLARSSSGWWVLALIYWGALVMLPSDVLYWTEPDLEPDPPID